MEAAQAGQVRLAREDDGLSADLAAVGHEDRATPRSLGRRPGPTRPDVEDVRPLDDPGAHRLDPAGEPADQPAGMDGGARAAREPAAIVLAACGMKIAKHGNRAASSQCGSADVLEALGVNIQAPPAVVERCLDTPGVAFLFAPAFHPATKHAAQVRKDLGVRTAFNLLGPLTNPARPTRQIVGVPRPDLTELLARSLALLGSERAWVVHGADGLDELSTTGYTKVSECRGDSVQTFYVHPADSGLPKATSESLKGGDAATHTAIVLSVLNGEHGAARDVVLLNAGAALFVGGYAGTVKAGIAMASQALDNGAARRVLTQLVDVSNSGARA